MANTYFTADLHVGHYNVLRLCNRNFSSITEMEHTFIANHNSIVTDKDEVWNLGDIGYRCDPEHIYDFLKKLNGRFRIILGNHDKVFRQGIQRGIFRDLFQSGKLEVIGLKAVIEDPSISISKMINMYGQQIFLSHYAHASFPMAFRGGIHLHGHSHGNLPISKYKIIDVGVDPNSFFPISFAQVMEMAKVKSDFSEKE